MIIFIRYLNQKFEILHKLSFYGNKVEYFDNILKQGQRFSAHKPTVITANRDRSHKERERERDARVMCIAHDPF